MHEKFTLSLAIDKYVGILYQPSEQNWQKLLCGIIMGMVK